MKTKIYIFVTFFVVAIMILGGVYVNQKHIDDTYNNAVEFIQKENFDEGLLQLENANPQKINRNEFLWDASHNELKECYKNTLPLYAYTLSKIEYIKEEKNMPYIHQHLELIDNDYSGELATEIKSFKDCFKIEYDEYLVEQERKAEEERIERRKREEERERELRESLKNKIPYEGMSESYINYTAMGNYHDKEYVVVGKGKRTEWSKNEYRWKNNNGKTILYVECRDGVVTDVIKYWEDKYWTADGKPIYSGTRSGYSSSSSGKKKVYNDDSYNVNDYYDAEDFYEDYYDDFYDYEDAEDYFDENRDW